MKNEQANVLKVVLPLSVVAFLVLGSFLTSFKILDLAYFFFILYCILRYLHIMKFSN